MKPNSRGPKKPTVETSANREVPKPTPVTWQKATGVYEVTMPPEIREYANHAQAKFTIQYEDPHFGHKMHKFKCIVFAQNIDDPEITELAAMNILAGDHLAIEGHLQITRWKNPATGGWMSGADIVASKIERVSSEYCEDEMGDWEDPDTTNGESDKEVDL